MATTTHPVALFEEGFMLVGVQSEDVEALGEQAVFDLVQHHPWVVEKGMPVVLVFETEDGDMEAFGDRQLVDAITAMDFDQIGWGHKLTLQWPEESRVGDEGRRPGTRRVHVAHATDAEDEEDEEDQADEGDDAEQADTGEV